MNSSRLLFPGLHDHRPASCAFLKTVLGVCLVGVILPALPVRAADGDLDLAFVPDAAYQVNALALGVIEGEFYFSYLSQPARRLRQDGSLDGDWSLDRPSGVRFIAELRRTPSGGWVIKGAFSPAYVYLDDGIGEAQRLDYVWQALGNKLFPQDDGDVVLGEPLSRVSPEGVKDPRFGYDARFVAAGTHQIKTTAIQDDLGRFVVAGNLKQVGDLERLGLARILPNGQVDPDWDVASALGIELNDEGRLNALPISLAAGPDNQVVVGIQFVSTHGEPTIVFAVLDGDGEVLATFPNPGLVQPTSPVVQPDGRILVGGTMESEPNTPLAAVVRLNADGSVDETFAVGISSANGWVQISSLALDSSGRLYMAGSFDAVNGVPRSGLARVQAYEPVPEAPSLAIAYHQPRIGTNEFLYLTASVGGGPEPKLQWYLDGVELPDQTLRGLRVLVQGEAQVGNYTIVASNSEGTKELHFPVVELAVRSPRPGVIDETFQRTLVEFPNVTQLLTLADGSVLVGGGDLYAQTLEPRAMVGKLSSDGYLDASFGDAGIVKGNGFVESLHVLPEGGILVAGQFTEFAGVQAYGLAELDAQGQLVPRNWPELDVPHVSAALRLPDGRQVIAGRFSTVAGESAYRLARLNGDLTLDETFTSLLEPWQFIDDLELDSMGRLLIAGERMFAVEVITNPPPAGLQRLLEDGTADPAFQKYEGNVRDVVVEPDGRLLTLGSVNGYLAPNRLTPDGALVVQFEQGGEPDFSLSMFPDHSMLRLPDGSVVGAYTSRWDHQLIRWHSNGRLDFNFNCVIAADIVGFSVQAVALLPDSALLVSTRVSGTVDDPVPPLEKRRLVRVPPDSDARLQIADLGGGAVRVQIATQPGKVYQVQSRPSLGAAPTLLGVITGDGYGQELRIEADGAARFIDYEAVVVEPW